jgi:ribose transport system ATP-binding protein
MSLVEMRSIEKRFGATTALDKVDLFLEAGEVHALVGENGSGKSTLMRVLSGAISADAGEMKLEGSRFRPDDPMAARKSGVAMIYQELALCPDLSVAENILLGMEPALIRSTEAAQKARDALAKLGHGNLDVGQKLRHLPIGMCQIIEIARAVAVGSKVVILDEPTSSLSKPDVENLFHVIRNLKATGHAVVYISHFLDEIEEIADRVSILRDGRLVETGFVGERNREEVVSLMVGRTIEDAYPRSTRSPGEPVLEFEGLSGRVKPANATLTLHRGEVLGIAGLNGSGRTELLRVIFGLDPVLRGELKIGQFRGYALPDERWRQGVGMLSEDRKNEGLALELSIADNLTLTHLPKIVSDQVQERAAAAEILKAGVKCRDAGQTVGELSGGNQQKVAFARLLYHDVDILLLDEPTRGIDVGSKQQIYSLIDELARSGKAVLMVSSYLPELLGVCDRIAVMSKGVLGPATEVRLLDQEKLMQEAVGS